MQVVDMPVTPLARGMWRYGGLPGISFENGMPQQHKEATASSRFQQQMATPTRCLEAKSAAEGAAVAVTSSANKRTPPYRPERPLPSTLPQSTPAMPSSSIACTDPDSRQSNSMSSERCDNDGNDGIVTYRSIDPVTGRVWGMPNAGGSGQCVDCPQRAKQPSTRCVDCQRRVAEELHETLPGSDIDVMRCTFDSLLEQRFEPGKRRDEIAKRMNLFFARLQAKKIPLDIQLQIRDAAEAVKQGEDVQSGKIAAKLAADQALWRAHKEWLCGLRTLLSP